MAVTASKYARGENDLYQTEPWVRGTAQAFPRSTTICVWEPAAVNHLMADVLFDHARSVYTSDIATYDRAHDEIYDFLKLLGDWAKMDAIITNPPYGKGKAIDCRDVLVDSGAFTELAQHGRYRHSVEEYASEISLVSIRSSAAADAGCDTRGRRRPPKIAVVG